MKFIKSIFCLLLVSMLSGLVTSCSDDKEKNLVGTWTHYDRKAGMIFDIKFFKAGDDRTFKLSGTPTDYNRLGYGVDGTWNISMGDKLNLEYNTSTIKPLSLGTLNLSDPQTNQNVELYLNNVKNSLELKKASNGILNLFTGSSLEFIGDDEIVLSSDGEKLSFKRKAVDVQQIDAFPVESVSEMQQSNPEPANNRQAAPKQTYNNYDYDEEALGDYDDFDWLSYRKATHDDLYWRNKKQLRIMRNWIYARHGYKFKSKDLQQYFSVFPWYQPRFSDVSSSLNKIEQANIQMIRQYE